jgi:hypothetical protein
MNDPTFKDDHEDTFDFLAPYLSPKHSNNSQNIPLPSSNHQQSSDVDNNKEGENNIDATKLINNITSSDDTSPFNSNATSTNTNTISTNTSTNNMYSGIDSDNKIDDNANGKEVQSPSLISFMVTYTRIYYTHHHQLLFPCVHLPSFNIPFSLIIANFPFSHSHLSHPHVTPVLHYFIFLLQSLNFSLISTLSPLHHSPTINRRYKN